MEKLESVQYSAALAVSGTWRGTSSGKLYAELGWESLSLRRRSKRLTLFYNIVNNVTHNFTRDTIPPHQQSQYSLRKHHVIGQTRTRTEKFKSKFYPHCLSEWNVRETETRLAPSVALFEKKMLLKIRPPPLENPSMGFMTQKVCPI